MFPGLTPVATGNAGAAPHKTPGSALARRVLGGPTMRQRALHAAWPLGLLLAAAVAACGHTSPPGVARDDRAGARAPPPRRRAHRARRRRGAARRLEAGGHRARAARRRRALPPPRLARSRRRRAAARGGDGVPRRHARRTSAAPPSPGSSPARAGPTHWANLWERAAARPRGEASPSSTATPSATGCARAFAANVPYDRFVYASSSTATGRNHERGRATRPSNGAVNWLAPLPRRAGGPRGHHVARLPRRADPVRAVPRPQDREVEAGRLPPLRRVLRAHRADADRRASMSKKRRSRSRDVDGPAFLRQGQEARSRAHRRRARPRALDGTDFSREPQPARRRWRAWMTAPENPWFAQGHRQPRLGALPRPRLRRARRRPPPVEPAGRCPSSSTRSPPTSPRTATTCSASCALICDTEAYQLAVAATLRATATEQLWSRYPLKPLGPDELLDSLVAATGLESRCSRGSPATTSSSSSRSCARQFDFLFDVDEEADDGRLRGHHPAGAHAAQRRAS